MRSGYRGSVRERLRDCRRLPDGRFAVHPNSLSYPRDKLAALRLAELESAVGILSGGKGKTVALGVPDQGVTMDSLVERRVIEVLYELIRSHDIGTVWTTWQHDAHIDHQHAAAIALGLCATNGRLRLWQFPIWSRFTGEAIGYDERLCTFESARYRALKRRAIAAHRSQMTTLIDDDPEGFTLDPAKQEHFLTFPEIFITRSRNERQTPHI